MCSFSEYMILNILYVDRYSDLSGSYSRQRRCKQSLLLSFSLSTEVLDTKGVMYYLTVSRRSLDPKVRT